MNPRHATLALLSAGLLVTASAMVMANDEHHPDLVPNQQVSPPAPSSDSQAPQTRGPGMDMPGMMSAQHNKSSRHGIGQEERGSMRQGQMPMAGMMARNMTAMEMSGTADGMEAFPGLGMTMWVEGRIAFVRTELDIREPQDEAWNAFAQAIRDNADMLGRAYASAVKRRASAEVPLTLPERLAAQEDWFTARLKGIGLLRQTMDDLYGVLSDEQKQTADVLLALNIGLESGRPMTAINVGGRRPMGRPLAPGTR